MINIISFLFLASLNLVQCVKFNTCVTIIISYINTEFMPLAFEIYGSASVSVNKLIQDLASTAAERTYTPYHVLLFYWRKRISFTLQYYNAWIINQAYLKLNNCGGGNIHRDLELDNIF